MKKLNAILMAALFVACNHGVAEANLLSNGGLDLPGGGPVVDDWTLDFTKSITGPTTDLLTLEGFADRTAPSGFGGFFKAFQGGDLAAGDLATAHVYQEVAGTAGTQYTFSGYAGAGGGYSGLIAGPTQSIFAIEFDNDNDFSNGALSVLDIDLAANGLGSGPGASFGYDQFSVAGIAPAGTTVVRVRASMIDGYSNPAGGDQAFVIDDFTLTAAAVPEPATAALIAFGCMFGTIGRRSAK